MTSVVIVNWNGSAYLPALLASLQPVNLASIVVVDNNSSDDSLQILQAFSNIHVVANEQNTGYATAANQGISLCTTTYVLLLNVDVEVLPGSIRLLEQQLEKDSAVAVVVPQLLFADRRLQPSLRTFPTAASISLYLSFLDRLIPSSYRLPARDHQHLRDVEQPMGAAMMIRKSAWEQIQGFDQQFFLYMEEVDFCYRIKKAGFRILYVPEAKMIHHAGGSSRQAWESSQQHLLQSIRLYFHKHSPEEERKLRWMLPAGLAVRAVVLFFTGRFRQSWFYFRNAFARP